MKRALGSLLVMLLLAASAVTTQGQNAWSSLKGPWEAWEPDDIAVGYTTKGSIVYAIGGMNRELLLSTDEGNAWTSLPVNEVLAVACAKNQPLTVLVSRHDGSHYVVARSIDGGMSWSNERVFNSPVSTIAISPDDVRTVYLGLGGASEDVNRPLWRSIDGGRSWENVVNLNIYAKITRIAFDPERPSIIYVTARGTMGGIWKSTDSGQSWSPRNAGMSNSQIASFCVTPAPDANVLYAGTYEQGAGEPRIYSSTDRGETWSVQSGVVGASDITIDPLHPNLVYAATTDGILCTKDFGASWLKRSTGAASRNGRRIQAVLDARNRVHVLLGTHAAFYRSDDDGDHWTERTSGMALVPCYAVAVNSAGMFSLAYGAKPSGTFVNRSTDGSTWNVLQDNTIFNSSQGSLFYGFAIAGSPANPSVLLASGTSGENVPQVLFRTSDAGNSWVKVYTKDFANQPCNIVFDPKDDRFVYTADVDQVLKSSDGGSTWERLPGSPPYVYALGVAAGGASFSKTLYAGGSRLVERSDDAGGSWSPAGTGLPSSVVALVCDPVDPQIVFAGTNHHRVYWTTNGGADWQPRSEGLYGDFVQSLIVQPAYHVLYACTADHYGAQTRVYRSTNLGETWRDISEGVRDVIVYGLSADPSNRNLVYAATDHGLYRLNDEENTPTTVDEGSGGLPAGYGLSQNYPNPFNPTTDIRFSVPNIGTRSRSPGANGRITDYGRVRLVVYDMLGKQVATPVDEEKAPGSYTVNFNASNLASGTYLYRLTAGGFTATRRMMLIK